MKREGFPKVFAFIAVIAVLLFGNTSSTHASVQRLLLKHGAEDEEATRKTFYHNNHLGSTALTTDENGEVLTRVYYYPYGTIRRTAAELPIYNFTGKERDQTTGLSYHSARYLSPTFAGWTQPDPLFHTLSDKSIELPWQASNPYGYGLGNPIQYTDPEGTFAFLPFLAVKLISTAVAFVGVKMAEKAAASQMTEEQAKQLNQKANSALKKTAVVQGTEVIGAGVGEVVGLGVRAGTQYLSKGSFSTAFQIAKNGGRHSGQLKQFLKQNQNQLNRSIKKFGKNIEKHEKWISNPKSKIPEWDTFSAQRQANTIHHWKEDIARAKELQNIAKDVAKQK